MISLETQWSRMRASMIDCVHFVALIALWQGIHWAHLEKWPTKLMMQSFPLQDVCTSVLKSSPTRSQRCHATVNVLSKPTVCPAHWSTPAHMSWPLCGFALRSTPWARRSAISSWYIAWLLRNGLPLQHHFHLRGFKFLGVSESRADMAHLYIDVGPVSGGPGWAGYCLGRYGGCKPISVVR